jgi:hypothetical protein
MLGRMPLTAGAMLTVYDKDDRLDRLYGENPVSFYAYLRLRPPRMEPERPRSTNRGTRRSRRSWRARNVSRIARRPGLAPR